MKGSRRRRRQSTPLMLFWSKRDQLRFINAVERFQSLVNDLDTMVAAKKRRARPKLEADTPNAGFSP